MLAPPAMRHFKWKITHVKNHVKPAGVKGGSCVDGVMLAGPQGSNDAVVKSGMRIALPPLDGHSARSRQNPPACER